MPDNSGTDGIANILNLMRQQQQEQQQERLRQQATNEQLARRMDQLAQMFNGMNTNLAPHRSLPNIAGLPTSMNMPPMSFPNPPPTHAAAGVLNPQAGVVSPSTDIPPTSTGLATPPGTAIASAAPTPRTATTATVAHATVPAAYAASAIAAAISAVPSMPNTGTHPLVANNPIMAHAVAPTAIVPSDSMRALPNTQQGVAPSAHLPSSATVPRLIVPFAPNAGPSLHSPLRETHFSAPFGAPPAPRQPNPLPHPLPPNQQASSQGRGRGRGRNRGSRNDDPDNSHISASSSRLSSSSRRRRGARRILNNSMDSDEFEDDDGYDYNRETKETYCKSLSMEKFSSENKEQEFSIWVQQFEEAVNRGMNPHCQENHWVYCLKWLPSMLKADAYAIWHRSEHKRDDWPELKRELDRAFEDPTIRTEWKSNMKAYMWEEDKVSLQSYAAKVKRYVDKYETEMEGCTPAVNYQYFLRFINGLPEDYAEQVGMSMASNCHDMSKALDICVRWQTIKKKKTNTKSEVCAAVTFEDPTVPARVTQNATEIIRLKNEVKQMKSAIPTEPSAQYEHHDHSRPQYAGRSPYRQSQNQAETSILR